MSELLAFALGRGTAANGTDREFARAAFLHRFGAMHLEAWESGFDAGAENILN